MISDRKHSILPVMKSQDEQSTITLSELHTLDSQQASQQQFCQFAVYLSANSHFNNSRDMQELMALDSQTIPKTPIRRVGCSDCLRNNLRCQNCQNCIGRGVVCCRSITCIYELRKYLSDKRANMYKKCMCTQRYQASTQQFAIDWRLFSLLLKLNNINKITFNYYLRFEVGILWVTEYTVDKEGRPSRIARNIFEQNFDPHPELVSKNELLQHNIRNFSNLVKERIRIYITYSNDWNISNMQESCREIIEELMAHIGLQQLKYKLQEAKQIENPYVSGAPLRSNFNLACDPLSQKLEFEADSPHLSRAINQNILFLYHPSRKILFVKNAKYEKSQQQTNVKAYPLTINTQFNRAVWFKDRKGDVFAIHDDNVSIFKYNLISKKLQQIIIKKDEHLKNFKHTESLIYIAQLDRVYYFDSKEYASSFYFNLYRLKKQQGQFSNCVSVNALHAIAFESKIKRFDSFFRVTYILQSTNNFKLKKNQVPVIYLLGYKKNYLPLPLCLLRVTDVHQRNVQVQEVIPAQGEFQNKVESLDFENGVHTIFRRNKREIIAFMGRINGHFVLAQGKIIRQQKQVFVEWNLHPLSVFTPTIRNISLSTPQRQAQLRQTPLDRFVAPKQEGMLFATVEQGDNLWLTDLNGFQTNNVTRYLSFLSKQARCVEMILSLNEGKYTCNLFNTY